MTGIKKEEKPDGAEDYVVPYLDDVTMFPLTCMKNVADLTRLFL